MIKNLSPFFIGLLFLLLFNYFGVGNKTFEVPDDVKIIPESKENKESEI